MSKQEVKVLFLSANPTDNNIRIDREVRDIESRIQRGKYRDRLQFIPKLAVQPDDIRAALLDVNPHIVHLSGHGDRLGSLIVENPKRGEGKDGYIKIKPAALGRLLELFENHIRCVLISACYSDEAIEAVHQHIPFVIGMQEAVHYDAARAFEVGFYDALVAGRPIPFAFDMGCSSMDMNDHDGEIPVLKMRTGDLGDLFDEAVEDKDKSESLAEEKLSGLAELANRIIDYCSKAYSTTDPQQALKELLKLSEKFIRLWRVPFPNSHIPGWLRSEHLNVFETLRRQGITVQKWQRNIRREQLLQFQADFQYEILESLNNKDKRLELEKIATRQTTELQRLEKAYTSFTRLKFDSVQRKQFNELFRNQQKIQYFIHGEPSHGQRWLYNRIIRLHHFFENDSGITYLPFKLDGTLGSEDIAGVISEKLEVRSPVKRIEDWRQEVADKLMKKLQHQHVLVAFQNPTLEELQKINQLIDGILGAMNLQVNLRRYKAIFITILNQLDAASPMHGLKPIDTDIFGRWIGVGKEENDEYILDHFDHLSEDDEDCLCDALIEIHGVNDPKIPAEAFIEKVAVDKFNLQWEKCKNQWLKY